MADGISIEVQGVQATSRYFRSKAGRIIPIVEPVFKNAGRRVVSRLVSGYDRRRGNVGVYIRTGTYGRRMQMKSTATSSRVRVHIFNMTPYAPYVGSHARQSWMHRDFWPTDVEALGAEKHQIVREVSAALIRGLH